MQVKLPAVPRDAVLPDYGNDGLYGFAHGLRGWLHDPGAAWPQAGIEADERRVVVLLIVDGLGDGFLARHGAGSALLAHRVRRMSSVFPSTTASAVTLLHTGLSPAEHGLTGWFIHDRRFGGVIAPLPLTRRGNGPIEAVRLAPRLFPYSSMFRGARRPVTVLSPEDIAFSRFSLHHSRGARVRPYKGLDQLAAAIVEEAAALRGKGGLVHAYYPVFDAISHAYGAGSPQALSVFGRIEARFGFLLQAMRGSGAVLLATADHGFIDAPEDKIVAIAPGSEVARMLAAPLFGERRTAFCALREGAEDEFDAWAAAELRGRAVVLAAGELLASGLLGPGKPNARLRERVGHRALLMERGWTLVDTVEGEKPHAMIGVHGGLSADEMWVPLIRAEDI
ncbi:alkaline phosphatase family protein [Thauera sinica]|uniref:Alkaline phosphatase family protein n=1 Tax=Thauera sinica TaxID=2665146 RepID=A0ABW1AKM8_9RHOO|nr:alkaline phosphatase family protein [Thauera sp. K11]ATE59831.1 phosphodiesterase [Thauera sp. K11]